MKKKKIIFWLVIIIFVCICLNLDTFKSWFFVEEDNVQILYQDESFLFEITGYEYSSLSNSIEIYIYIENNSDTKTTFTIDEDISISGNMIEGEHFSQNVSSNSKISTSFIIKDLDSIYFKKSNIKYKKMSLNINIYQSSNYYIDNRIVDDLQITYEF